MSNWSFLPFEQFDKPGDECTCCHTGTLYVHIQGETILSETFPKDFRTLEGMASLRCTHCTYMGMTRAQSAWNRKMTEEFYEKQ